ncbi:MAG: VCBS repeat-containing protein, partial [Bifidobacteriaceae bacterium]|nr:VCBS repeat-containing protein [Bifidobacteriaceae bacterium]
GTTATGVVLTSSHVVIVGTSYPHSDPLIPAIPGYTTPAWPASAKNAYVLTYDRTTGAKTFTWLTGIDPATTTTSIYEPRITEIAANDYVVLFSVREGGVMRTEYRRLNASGTVTAQASLPLMSFDPSSNPVVVDGQITWVGWGDLTSSVGTARYLYQVPAVMGGNDSIQLLWTGFTGSSAVGGTLTASSVVVPSDATVTYQWFRDGVPVGSDPTYTVTREDLGRSFTVTATASKAGLATVTKTSAAVVGTCAPVSLGSSWSYYPPTTVTTLSSQMRLQPTSVSPSYAELSYQWLRDGVPIDGATSDSYFSRLEDRGALITLQVTATADGCSATGTSFIGYSVAADATGPARVIYTPQILGTPQVGQTLSVGAITANPPDATLTYQWKRGSTVVGTGATYTVQEADIGWGLTVVVTANAPGYDAGTPVSSYSVTPTGGPIQLGAVTITGTAQTGATVTASVASVTPSSAALSYQWKVGGTVVGGNSPTYTVQAADVGQALTVTVTASRTNYTTSTVTSAPVTVAATPASIASVAITGTAQPGQVLTAAVGAVTPSGATLTYQWKLGGTVVGGNSPTYTVQTSDVGQSLTVTVTASATGYANASQTSAPVTVAAVAASIASVSITGTPQPGQVLTAAVGAVTPSGATLTYQWKLGGTVVGGNSPTYTVQASDVSKQLTVTVTANAAGYATASRTSAAVTIIALPAGPQDRTYSAFTLSADMTGNGQGEVLTITSTTGAMTRHAPDKAVAKLTATKLVNSGLQGSQIFGPGDWDVDKKADVITVDAAGAMWLWKGNGKGAVATTAVQAGRGWSAYRIVPAGDLDSDGINDMLAIDGDGNLWLYAGDGKGGFKKGRTQVGHGWNGFDCYAAGDLNKDGKADILGINSAGLLYAYFGKGNGTFQSPVQVGRGWGAFTLAAGADLNGDGLADIVGRNDTTGQLYYYQSKGGGQFQGAKLIATGW